MMTEADEIARTLPTPAHGMTLDQVRVAVAKAMPHAESMQVIDNVAQACIERRDRIASRIVARFYSVDCDDDGNGDMIVRREQHEDKERFVIAVQGSSALDGMNVVFDTLAHAVAVCAEMIANAEDDTGEQF